MNDNLIIHDNQSPMRSDAVQNRERLLETAARLFNQHGVEAVSMSQIAREAGVGKGTLYRHFNDKVDLCLALLDETQRVLQENTFATLRTSMTPYDKLVWFMEEVVRYVSSHIELLFAGTGSLGAYHLDHPAHLWWRDTILGLLTQIGVDGNRQYIADILYVMVDVVTIRFQIESLGYSHEQICEGLNDAIQRLCR